MPAAMIGRIRMSATGMPVAEYLHREETLFVDPEWSWVAGREQAMIFPTLEEAEAEKLRQRERDAQEVCGLFAIVCGPTPEVRAAWERRGQDRVASVLSSAAVAGDMDESSAPKGVAPQAAKRGHHGRRRAARQNRQVAEARKRVREKALDAAQEQAPNRVEVLKEIYRTKVAPRHVTPEECYRQTCAHLGERAE